MIVQAIILSLQITAIYTLFQQGMLLGKVRIGFANIIDKAFGLRASRVIQKPLFDCLICMSGIWTVLLTLQVDQPFITIDLPLILTVCGINVLIDKIISYEGEAAGARVENVL